MFRILSAVGAVSMALAASSPGNAETIASACRLSDGTLYNFSVYHASPRGGCSKGGSIVVRFTLEQPNHAMAKRRNTLLAPDRVILATFPPGTDLPTFEVGQELDGSQCSLFVDVYDTSATVLPARAGILVPPPPPPPTSLGTAEAEEMTSVVVAAAEAGSIDGDPSQIEIIAAGGETLIVEDTKAILDAAGVQGCYVAGLFRYFSHHRERDAR